MNVARVEAVDIITENRSFVGLASLHNTKFCVSAPENSKWKHIREIPSTDSYNDLETRDPLLHRNKLPQKRLIRVGDDYTDMRHINFSRFSNIVERGCSRSRESWAMVANAKCAWV